MAQSLDLTVEGPAGPLSGTLTAGGFVQDAALILPGSGPTDRNGNSAVGLQTDAYRLLAEALFPEGVATLRADKRGVGDSGGDGNDVSLAAYRADIDLLAATLREETGLDCVWLIGHSEGGILAIAAADLPGICGLLLLATPGRPLGPILLEQIGGQPGAAPFLDAFETALTAFTAGEDPDVTGLPPALATLFSPITAGYLRELLNTDPAALLSEVALPVGIIGGTEDIQVPPLDAETLAAARPDATLLILDGMTHTLKEVPEGDMAANLASYSDPDLPLHPGLIPAILEIIRFDQ